MHDVYRLNLANVPAVGRAAYVLSCIETAARRLEARPNVVAIDQALSIDEAKLKAGGLSVRRIARRSSERLHADLLVDDTEAQPAPPEEKRAEQAPAPISAPPAIEEQAKRAVVLHEVGPFQQLSMSPFDALLEESRD